jgi:Glycyl-tRNA synthetase (class II)
MKLGTPGLYHRRFSTLEDNSVTIRDRDTMNQKRLKINEVRDFLILNYNI